MSILIQHRMQALALGAFLLSFTLTAPRTKLRQSAAMDAADRACFGHALELAGENKSVA